MTDSIRIRGARQNNLKHIDLDLPLSELIVVTGVSGSGKSSLVFDTLYAEGQRRYVETFSPYARQFLDRMDRPQVDRIENVPPAIAIDQTNPVRTSRSTVGTMTELTDHLKLLYARAARLYCRGCGAPVARDTPESILAALAARSAAAGDPRLVLCFPLSVPDNFSEEEVRAHLERQGYTRVHAREGQRLQVVQDRFRFGAVDRTRVLEGVEAALRLGGGRLSVHAQDETGELARWQFSTDLHCADCDIHYAEPTPSHFSFNSALGACDTCRGFGRVIGVDLGLVIPDSSLSLRAGAIRPWQGEGYAQSQQELQMHALAAGVPMDVPWRELSAAQRTWVIEGDPRWKSWERSWPEMWYGVRRFFDWLESKAYKMHVRVMLSRYRSYTECPACRGARLKPESLLWRLASEAPGAADARSYNLHELACQPVGRLREFFADFQLPGTRGEAAELVLGEVRSRLAYLCEVGLSYLSLDRQSRTLSGGEVQRINLTTALGTSLTRTLFVLDEPSIGLHPRDTERINAVMRRLCDAGNTLVVVEHDPAVMLAADRIIDVGPGPGERGGTVLFNGSPQALQTAATLTADYLAGRRRVVTGRERLTVADWTPRLTLRGACEHNLQRIDLALPLRRLVAITGVSGSGKSTLVQDVLYPALLKHFGLPTEAPGGHDALDGAEQLEAVVMVDQSAIGKTTRSNPASYVGAFDTIRARFARQPEAQARGYTAGTFSFSAGDGRCPSCGGNGFEHVEMQFLSDVYLRCPDCDGTRYRPEVREILLAGKSIAQVLELTVHEALAFFAGDAEIARVLQPLVDVGLDYLKLGQPVPTLSGGEAQRLKLAAHLVEAQAGANKRRAKGRARADTHSAVDGGPGKLFLFDEPTTGLHFDDVAKLLRALVRLVDAGHSVVVIEHNLDMIAAADWVIDLGPEGGEGGGRIVAEGTVEQIEACSSSHTGAALASYRRQFGLRRDTPAAAVPTVAEPRARYRPAAPAAVSIVHAREHNLRNVSVNIPHGRFTVVTGVSGSGKSTLAFDVLFAEGQRRYLESLNAYARQFVQPASRPEVDAIFGIPPTVAIEQRTSRGGRRSTVGTLTELHHYLRLLYVRLGTQYCPDCEVAIEPQSFEAIVARLLRDYRGVHIGLLAPLVSARKGIYKELAQWAAQRGFTHLRVDGAYLPTSPWPKLDRYKEHDIELPVADLSPHPRQEAALREALSRALEFGKGVVHVLPLAADASPAGPLTVFSTQRACPCCGKSYPEPDPRLFSYNSRRGWCPSCVGTGVTAPAAWRDPEAGEEAMAAAEFAELEDGVAETVCPACNGARLNPVARAVRFGGLSLPALSARSVDQVADFFAALALDGRAAEVARDVLAELCARLSFLHQVGLGYLALDRGAPTLSGGEAQRIRLAAQLGGNLTGVCYVLDEPSIGLHPRDNRVLLDTLLALQAKGNTVVVVEHDEDTIRHAQHLLDLGPGAGSRGGRLVAEGDVAALMAAPESVTGACLRTPLQHPLRPPRALPPQAPALLLRGAYLHNLCGIEARFPLGYLSVVTGVSGSGKSSLARDVLLANLRRRVRDGNLAAGAKRSGGPGKTTQGGGQTAEASALVGCSELSGWEAVDRVLEVDQTPIGKTPRSCPATYVGFWDAIRKLYADTEGARLRGWSAARFSFNTGDGRCPACDGQGMQTVAMNFLPDVKVRCEACDGARFNPETLAVSWRGKSIGEVLALSVDEAVEFFAAHPPIFHPLTLLQDVGLGYLTLGQASPTLSGGEAQRIKLVTELAKARPETARPRGGGRTVYVLDEPTVGLHMADVAKLIQVLQRLTEAGHTAVVVEHDLDVMAEADWIIDLGPEGGEAGGRLVAMGAPAAVMATPGSHTGRMLREFMTRRSAAGLERDQV